MSHLPRAEEEAAARTKAEKQNRELQAQLQETQDDLESEREIKLKVDRQRRQADDVSAWACQKCIFITYNVHACIYHFCLLPLLTRFSQELDKLREMLEESETSTQAQHEIRAQRESELATLKKSLEDERADHESVVASMRQKHSRAVGELNDQIDSMKKVGKKYNCGVVRTVHVL